MQGEVPGRMPGVLSHLILFAACRSWACRWTLPSPTWRGCRLVRGLNILCISTSETATYESKKQASHAAWQMPSHHPVMP